MEGGRAGAFGWRPRKGMQLGKEEERRQKKKLIFCTGKKSALFAPESASLSSLMRVKRKRVVVAGLESRRKEGKRAALQATFERRLGFSLFASAFVRGASAAAAKPHRLLPVSHPNSPPRRPFPQTPQETPVPPQPRDVAPTLSFTLVVQEEEIVGQQRQQTGGGKARLAAAGTGVDGPPHPKTAKNYVADDNRTAKKALPKIAPAPAASAKQP